MKILVTGGSGYIGSVTTELLCNDGHEVTVFDNLERGHREAVDPRARLIVGDLRSPDGIRDAMQSVKPDAVVHFAAYALVGESMQEPHLYFENNVGGGLNLLDAMQRTFEIIVLKADQITSNQVTRAICVIGETSRPVADRSYCRWVWPCMH